MSGGGVCDAASSAKHAQKIIAINESNASLSLTPFTHQPVPSMAVLFFFLLLFAVVHVLVAVVADIVHNRTQIVCRVYINCVCVMYNAVTQSSVCYAFYLSRWRRQQRQDTNLYGEQCTLCSASVCDNLFLLFGISRAFDALGVKMFALS